MSVEETQMDEDREDVEMYEEIHLDEKDEDTKVPNENVPMNSKAFAYKLQLKRNEENDQNECEEVEARLVAKAVTW